MFVYEIIHPSVDIVFFLALNFDRSSSPKVKDCMVKVHVTIIQGLHFMFNPLNRCIKVCHSCYKILMTSQGDITHVVCHHSYPQVITALITVLKTLGEPHLLCKRYSKY